MNMDDSSGAPAAPPRRSRWIIPLVCVLVALAIGVGVWLAAVGGDDDPAAESDDPAQESGEAASVPEGFEETYAEVASGVGRVLVTTCDSEAQGTGFLLTPATMATSAQLVAGAKEVTVELGGEAVSATVKTVDDSRDLAVLQLEKSVDGHAFTLARSDPKKGTRVVAIGYPDGESQTVTEGTISSPARDEQMSMGWFEKVMATDTPLHTGSSGGPLMTLDGVVVGVAYFKPEPEEHANLVVPASAARPALQRNAGLTQPAAPWCTASAADVTAGVERTLTEYFEAVNALDYGAAMSSLTDRYRKDTFSDDELWFALYESNHRDRLHIAAVDGPADAPTVWATFRSQQAPGYGPIGAEFDTCLIWSQDYEFVKSGDRWLIDDARGHGMPAWTACR
jgi:hypothetical protein